MKHDTTDHEPSTHHRHSSSSLSMLLHPRFPLRHDYGDVPSSQAARTLHRLFPSVYHLSQAAREFHHRKVKVGEPIVCPNADVSSPPSSSNAERRRSLSSSSDGTTTTTTTTTTTVEGDDEAEDGLFRTRVLRRDSSQCEESGMGGDDDRDRGNGGGRGEEEGESPIGVDVARSFQDNYHLSHTQLDHDRSNVLLPRPTSFQIASRPQPPTNQHKRSLISSWWNPKPCPISIALVCLAATAAVVAYTTHHHPYLNPNTSTNSPNPHNPPLQPRHLSTNSTNCDSPPPSSVSLHPAIQYTLIPILVLFSAFFSGLTLSLMGLDTIQLEIVMSGDDDELARAAERILPVRKKSNLLLCTLLLGNVAVNTLLGILMADLTSGTIGFLVSTGLIVIFGEILPQALFSRYALQVGQKAVPLVKFIIVLLYIIAKPLAACLDKMLGHELGTTYSKAEISKLLEIHVKEERISRETGIAMTGALKYQDVLVKDVMTPLENTFMISVEDKLNFDTMSRIFKTGYSRIPVFEGGDVQNVIGLLFTKDLIFIDPEDETPVRNFCQIFGRAPHVVWPDDKLGDVLRYLKKGHTHMALVRGTTTNKSPDLDPVYELEGIVTLEDIIEEIIGEEILDETDAWVDGEHLEKVDRAAGFDWASLRLLDAKIVDQTLSEEEVKAVAAHLRTNHSSAVVSLSDRQLLKMIAATPVVELPSAPIREMGQPLPGSAHLLYEKNVPSDVCTLLLGGKVTVVAGVDNFRSDVSSWTVLGAGALEEQKYIPDFSAYVSGSSPCRCLRFTKKIFAAAREASGLEGSVGPRPPPSTATSRSRVVECDEEGMRRRNTSLVSNAAPVTVVATSGSETGNRPSLSVSIHDELSANAKDAAEDVRGRRSVLLDTLLSNKNGGSNGTTAAIERSDETMEYTEIDMEEGRQEVIHEYS